MAGRIGSIALPPPLDARSRASPAIRPATSAATRPDAGPDAGPDTGPDAGPDASPHGGLRRRHLLAAGAALAVARPAGAAERATIRLGLVRFGTIQWIADVIARHRLDAAHDITVAPLTLASTDAGRIAAVAGQVDMVVLDWFFVAAQRAAGTKLCFSPLPTPSGALMAPAGSPLRGLADLNGRRLGVAGGPADKSWLLVQAAARRQAGIDLAAANDLAYGAPPLLGAKLLGDELDAVLTFWNFAATLEAAGCARVVSVGDCAAALGLPPAPGLIGFVFSEDWAVRSAGAADRFLAAAADAVAILAHSEAEWQALRPAMGNPEDAVFDRLRARFSQAAAAPADPAQAERDAARLFALVQATGGARATGGLQALPSGVFWPHA